MIKQIMASLKRVKHWQAYAVAILITLMFCLIWPTLSQESDMSGAWPGLSTPAPSGNSDGSLEDRMTQTLSAIKGVGKVSVVIAYEQEVVATFSGGAPLKPRGAVIVAEGASDIGVKMELCRAVRALLGVDMTAIEVFEMHGE